MKVIGRSDETSLRVKHTYNQNHVGMINSVSFHFLWGEKVFEQTTVYNFGIRWQPNQLDDLI